ncbi:MAG: hypothetical protein ACK5MV_04905 [Aminipila sp.]
MKELFILIICIIFIVIAFLSLSVRKTPQRRTMPEGLEEYFRQYCELLMAKLNLNITEVTLKRFRLLSEVPFEEGQFEYYSFDYTITPEKAVVDGKGIILNSTELLEKSGLKGKPLLLFYRQGDEMYEVSFLDDRDIAQKGYKGYVNFLYTNLKPWPIDDEFSLSIDGNVIRLWENIKGEAPFPYAVQTRTRTQDLLSYTAQFTDTWEGQELKIATWVQFERKRELIYLIKSTNPVAETMRGIHVGSTLEDLKKKYPRILSYAEDFKGAGPCYGFMAKDDTKRYIAFFVENEKVKEIWVTDGFDERAFIEPTGYVDNDVKWVMYDNTEKLSERYAREIYVGQHKSDFDPNKVFNSFIAKELHMVTIKESGVLEDKPGQRIYFVVCQKKGSNDKLYVEVKVTRIKLSNSVTGEEIWIPEQYRSQLVSEN